MIVASSQVSTKCVTIPIFHLSVSSQFLTSQNSLELLCCIIFTFVKIVSQEPSSHPVSQFSSLFAYRSEMELSKWFGVTGSSFSFERKKWVCRKGYCSCTFQLHPKAKSCCHQRLQNHYDTSALTPGKQYRLMHHSFQEDFFFLHLPEGSHNRILVECSNHMSTSK